MSELDDSDKAIIDRFAKFEEAQGRKPNPWAICSSVIDRTQNKDKWERCVQHVKQQYGIKGEEYGIQKMEAKATSAQDLIQKTMKGKELSEEPNEADDEKKPGWMKLIERLDIPTKPTTISTEPTEETEKMRRLSEASKAQSAKDKAMGEAYNWIQHLLRHREELYKLEEEEHASSTAVGPPAHKYTPPPKMPCDVCGHNLGSMDMTEFTKHISDHYQRGELREECPYCEEKIKYEANYEADKFVAQGTPTDILEGISSSVGNPAFPLEQPKTGLLSKPDYEETGIADDFDTISLNWLEDVWNHTQAIADKLSEFLVTHRAHEKQTLEDYKKYNKEKMKYLPKASKLAKKYVGNISVSLVCYDNGVAIWQYANQAFAYANGTWFDVETGAALSKITVPKALRLENSRLFAKHKGGGKHLPWDECIRKMKSRGYSDDSAKRICAYIKRKWGHHEECEECLEEEDEEEERTGRPCPECRHPLPENYTQRVHHIKKHRTEKDKPQTWNPMGIFDEPTWGEIDEHGLKQEEERYGYECPLCGDRTQMVDNVDEAKRELVRHMALRHYD
jgi:hypothetical protein